MKSSSRVWRAALCVAVVCVLFVSSSSADMFGTGGNQFTIDFVTIGNPGNPADTTGTPFAAGRADYVYRMGQHEISRDMITKANAAGSLGITLADMSSIGGNGVGTMIPGASYRS